MVRALKRAPHAVGDITSAYFSSVNTNQKMRFRREENQTFQEPQCLVGGKRRSKTLRGPGIQSQSKSLSFGGGSQECSRELMIEVHQVTRVLVEGPTRSPEAASIPPGTCSAGSPATFRDALMPTNFRAKVSPTVLSFGVILRCSTRALLPAFLGVDSPILSNHCPFQEPAIFAGFPEVL